jgi:acetyl-CoA carboxylase biotin carboxyl carrier protein
MDLKDIKRVIQMVEEAQISHFSMEIDGTKIEVKKEWGTLQATPASPVMVSVPAAPAMSVAAPAETSAESAPAPAADAGLVAVKSQMVGTFYASSKPDAPPYVKPGDSVSVGQVVCIIEAMKLFNEIESDHAGTIEKICVENGAPVEFGQTLFLIRP